MDLGVAFVADPQPAEVVQVREAALDDPALFAQAGAMRHAPACDEVPDVAGAQDPAVLVVVVATIGQQGIGLLPWPADFPGDRSGVQLVQQRQQLGDVVAVSARQGDGERDAVGVDEQVVL